MFDINKVIDELKKTNPNGFIIESHFQVEFGYALKRAYPSTTEIVFEWSQDKNRVDLFAVVGDERIGFEFKYFTKEELVLLNNGLQVQLKQQAARDLSRIGFWEDVSELEDFKQKKIIDRGFCLLMTNDEDIFAKLNPNKNLDYEFEISDGPKNKGDRVRLNSKGKETHRVKIEHDYDLKHESYNNMYLLALEVK